MEREFPIIGITPDLLKWIKALKENYQTHLDDISRLICEELNDISDDKEVEEEKKEKTVGEEIKEKDETI